MYSLLVRGVLWGVLFSGATIVAQLGLTLVVGRESPELLGLLNVIEIVNGGALAFFFVGGGVSLTNFLNHRNDVGSAPVALTSVLIAATTMMALFLVGHVFEIELDYTQCQIVLLGCIGVLWLFINHVAVEHAARFDYRAGNVLEKGANLLVPIALFAIAYWSELTVDRILYVALAAYCVMAAMGAVLIKRPIRWWWSDLRSYYTSDVGFLTATYIVVFIYERIDQILILHYFDLAALGIYFVGYKMSFSVRLLSTIILKAAYPLMSHIENSTDQRMTEMSLVLLRMNYIIAGVAAAGLCLGGEFLLGLYGEEYIPYRGILYIMAVTRVTGVLNLVYANVINAKGEGREFFKISIASVALQIILIVTLVGPAGLHAMALARLGAVLLGNVLTVVAVRRWGEFDRAALLLAVRYGLLSVLAALVARYAATPMAISAVACVVVVLVCLDSRSLWSIFRARQIGSEI